MADIQQPSKRYLEGLVLAEMDSSKEWGDPPDDKVVKTLFVKATLNAVGAYDLVALVEVEITGLAEHSDDDEGFIEVPVEVYRIPFPRKSETRKAILRELQTNPPFYRA